MTKCQQVFKEMLAKNEAAFTEFTQLHNSFVQNPNKYRAEFNLKGEAILQIIRDYESLLTRDSDNSSFSKFSTNLSEKFWEQIRKVYPKIDFIGVT